MNSKIYSVPGNIYVLKKAPLDMTFEGTRLLKKIGVTKIMLTGQLSIPVSKYIIFAYKFLNNGI